MKEIKEMYPSWGDDHGVRLGNVKISDLHDFKEHPFHVVEDTALFELAKSIEDKGVLVPLIVRANPYGDGYEIIAGHRRKAACKWAGLSEVSVMVVEMDDNEAVIATETRIHLAVGLPLKWVQAQRESFKKYLTRERYVSLKYKKVDYLIEIVDCTVMPQGYAAVAENLKDSDAMPG